eukprot:188765_1
MQKILRDIIPKLSVHKHKGQDGRLCVIGGSLEYTGAAYFAGKSILRCGGDLVHIICDKRASTAIKSYCPELMVAPYLDCETKDITNNLNIWIKQSLSRMNGLIIGPGLGRNENIMNTISFILNESFKYKLPIVMDGDALFLLSLIKYRNIFIKNDNIHKNIILTPNAMEFRRLWINYILEKDINDKLEKNNTYLPPFDTSDLFEKLIINNDEEKKSQSELKCDVILSCKDFENIQHIKDTALLANTLGGITILRKGAIDVITNGNKFILIGKPYSFRRCGGQGDILSGVTGLWLHWTNVYYNKNDNNDNNDNDSVIVAAYAGSYLMRHFAVEAFNKYKRSTLTNDMIECIPTVMDTQFPTISSL